MKPALVFVLSLALLPMAAAQRRGHSGGDFAMPPDHNLHQVVVTVVPRHKGPQKEPIEQAAVRVQQNGKDDNIRNWQRISAQTAVDLAVIIDDDTGNISVQLGDVRNFIKELPPNVRLGVGYMSAGAILFTQAAFTPDRNLIIQKLRAPSGVANSSPSPYSSVQYLMQRWRPHPGQVHEMLLISDGVEHLGGNNASNITLKKAVVDTVQSGVVVYSIFVDSASSAGASQNGGPVTSSGSFPGSVGPGIIRGLQSESGSNGAMNLGELTEATGGMTYADNNGTPPRFTSYLDDLLTRLNNQYLLAFDSSKARSGLDSIKIDVRAPDDNVTAPKQIFIAN